MKKLVLGSVALISVAGVHCAMANDLPVKAPPPARAAYNWTGWYGGFTAGATWGQYDPRTAAVADGYLDAVDAAAVTAAGIQNIKTNGFAAGIEGGYNWQTGRWVLGLEADLEAVHLIGQTNSGGVPYPDLPGSVLT